MEIIGTAKFALHAPILLFQLYTFLCADLVLSNKLVLYDLEKQAMGWTEYNCEYCFCFHFTFFSFRVDLENLVQQSMWKLGNANIVSQPVRGII